MRKRGVFIVLLVCVGMLFSVNNYAKEAKEAQKFLVTVKSTTIKGFAAIKDSKIQRAVANALPGNSNNVEIVKQFPDKTNAVKVSINIDREMANEFFLVIDVIYPDRIKFSDDIYFNSKNDLKRAISGLIGKLIAQRQTLIAERNKAKRLEKAKNRVDLISQGYREVKIKGEEWKGDAGVYISSVRRDVKFNWANTDPMKRKYELGDPVRKGEIGGGKYPLKLWIHETDLEKLGGMKKEGVPGIDYMPI